MARTCTSSMGHDARIPGQPVVSRRVGTCGRPRGGAIERAADDPGDGPGVPGERGDCAARRWLGGDIVDSLARFSVAGQPGHEIAAEVVAGQGSGKWIHDDGTKTFATPLPMKVIASRNLS